jgi:hypothetical protein
MIARFFSACGDVGSLRQVFEDYLQHCEELFMHLPKEECYKWLRDYNEDGRDESEQIVEFLVDLIDEPEINQSQRLLHVLADLAKTRPELVSRICCRRLPAAEPLLRERLEVLLDTLAWLCPDALAPYLEPLATLLKERHFRVRMTLISVIRRVAAAAALQEKVTRAADEAERAYSSIIAYPARRFLLTEPSPEFVAFLHRGALFDFGDRLGGINELLHISPTVILTYLERTLHDEGWNEAEEVERRKEDWKGNVREKRVVWIVPRFHTRVSNLLQKTLIRSLFPRFTFARCWSLPNSATDRRHGRRRDNGRTPFRPPTPKRISRWTLSAHD